MNAERRVRSIKKEGTMIYWIRRIAMIFACLTFFVIFFTNAGLGSPFSPEVLFAAAAKALIGAALFWLAGFIVSDILFKGVITDIETGKEDLIEGGLVQRVHLYKENSAPGGLELPYATTAAVKKSLEAKKDEPEKPVLLPHMKAPENAAKNEKEANKGNKAPPRSKA